MNSQHGQSPHNQRAMAPPSSKLQAILTSLMFFFFMHSYELLWLIAKPFLRRHHRLKEGFNQRLVPENWPVAPEPKACKTVWIQAASGGEALIVGQLVASIGLAIREKSIYNEASHCTPYYDEGSLTSPQVKNESQSYLDTYTLDKNFFSMEAPLLEVVCTTCTKQGLEILTRIKEENTYSEIRISPAYFPLDMPKLIEKAVCRIKPDLVVTLETEVWPALFYILKKNSTPLFIANGRITKKSFSAYLWIKSILAPLFPHTILATADQDVIFFKKLFQQATVEKMPNIKFDIAQKSLLEGAEKKGLPSPWFVANKPEKAPLVLLASVREEEEDLLMPTIQTIIASSSHEVSPLVVIAPRHIHRAKEWGRKLSEQGIIFSLRSNFSESNIRAQVVIWDSFGDLPFLYGCADSVFVGGSLAPLGGQNFLEPLAHGCIPCVGPYHSNFKWVGDSLFEEGLVIHVEDSEQLTKVLLASLKADKSKETILAVKEQFLDWLSQRVGGSQIVAKKIISLLEL